MYMDEKASRTKFKTCYPHFTPVNSLVLINYKKSSSTSSFKSHWSSCRILVPLTSLPNFPLPHGRIPSTLSELVFTKQWEHSSTILYLITFTPTLKSIPLRALQQLSHFKCTSLWILDQCIYTIQVYSFSVPLWFSGVYIGIDVAQAVRSMNEFDRNLYSNTIEVPNGISPCSFELIVDRSGGFSM